MILGSFLEYALANQLGVVVHLSTGIKLIGGVKQIDESHFVIKRGRQYTIVDAERVVSAFFLQEEDGIAFFGAASPPKNHTPVRQCSMGKYEAGQFL